jgi:hypothetical protein
MSDVSDPFRPQVLREHLEALCPELRAVVDDAEAAGNEVMETWQAMGSVVRLRAPRPVLTAVPASVRGVLSYVAVNDPHWWLGEIHCRRHPGWCIALSYTGPRDAELPDLGLPVVPTND